MQIYYLGIINYVSRDIAYVTQIIIWMTDV